MEKIDSALKCPSCLRILSPNFNSQNWKDILINKTKFTIHLKQGLIEIRCKCGETIKIIKKIGT